MSCCSEYQNIGCVDSCESNDIGFNATQTGVHTFEFRVGNNSWMTKEATFSIGGDIIIPAQTLPETGEVDFKVKQPDGTYYSFGTTDCGRITTQVFSSIVT